MLRSRNVGRRVSRLLRARMVLRAAPRVVPPGRCVECNLPDGRRWRRALQRHISPAGLNAGRPWPSVVLTVVVDRAAAAVAVPRGWRWVRLQDSAAVDMAVEEDRMVGVVDRAWRWRRLRHSAAEDMVVVEEEDRMVAAEVVVDRLREPAAVGAHTVEAAVVAEVAGAVATTGRADKQHPIKNDGPIRGRRCLRVADWAVDGVIVPKLPDRPAAFP